MNTSKWIDFREVPTHAAKTRRWAVVTKGTVGHVLGTIEWYPPWRKYAFSPEGGMVFEESCLRGIATFCENSTHRVRRRELRLVPAAEVAS